MPRKYLFVDEAGNFDFSDGGSEYFILTSVALDDCAIGDEMLALRRELVWNGADLTDAFHATTDKQTVRDSVYDLIARYRFRVDATVFHKRKALPKYHKDEPAFYELAWYLHMQYVAPRVAGKDDDLMVVGASFKTKKQQQLIGTAIAGVVRQTAKATTIRSTYWPAASDPCLQVADYCCWAIQRKWERNDPRSYVLIANRIASEFEVFRFGRVLYY